MNTKRSSFECFIFSHSFHYIMLSTSSYNETVFFFKCRWKLIILIVINSTMIRFCMIIEKWQPYTESVKAICSQSTVVKSSFLDGIVFDIKYNSSAEEKSTGIIEKNNKVLQRYTFQCGLRTKFSLHSLTEKQTFGVLFNEWWWCISAKSLVVGIELWTKKYCRKNFFNFFFFFYKFGCWWPKTIQCQHTIMSSSMLVIVLSVTQFDDNECWALCTVQGNGCWGSVKYKILY